MKTPSIATSPGVIHHPDVARVVCAVAVALASSILWPSWAEGCICTSHFASIVWPRQGSEGVPIDTMMIVKASVASDLRHTLRDQAGAEVPLVRTRTLDASDGCGYGMQDVLFLRPERPLGPKTTYRLALRFALADGGAPRDGMVSPEVTFTTSVSPRGAAPPPTIDRWLFAQLLQDGSRVLQIFAAAAGPEPAFLVAKGAPATAVVALGPIAFETPTGVSLGKAPCAEIEFVDVASETLRTERLCEPERCDSPQAYRCGTCGENCGGDTWASWQRRPVGCGASPGLPPDQRSTDAAAPPTHAPPDSGVGDAPRRGASVDPIPSDPPAPRAGACTLAGHPAETSAAPLALVALLVSALGRRRPRGRPHAAGPGPQPTSSLCGSPRGVCRGA